MKTKQIITKRVIEVGEAIQLNQLTALLKEHNVPHMGSENNSFVVVRMDDVTAEIFSSGTVLVFCKSLQVPKSLKQLLALVKKVAR